MFLVENVRCDDNDRIDVVPSNDVVEARVVVDVLRLGKAAQHTDELGVLGRPCRVSHLVLDRGSSREEHVLAQIDVAHRPKLDARVVERNVKSLQGPGPTPGPRSELDSDPLLLVLPRCSGSSLVSHFTPGDIRQIRLWPDLLPSLSGPLFRVKSSSFMRRRGDQMSASPRTVFSCTAW